MKALVPWLKPLRSAPGGTVWLVGGVVRDALLGRPLRDVDLAVKGDPKALVGRIGAASKSRPFALDAARGTWRVVVPAGDRPRVFDVSKLQGPTIEADLRARDFTINAMALPLERLAGRRDWKSAVVDLFAGRKDLAAKTVRVVDEDVLKADPLRLLRAFRFSAELGFKIEPETLAAVAKHRARLKKSAAERVREELFKILVTPAAAATLRAMDKARLLTVIFPEGEAMRKTAHVYYGKEGVLGHSLDALASFDRLIGELPAYFPDHHGALRAHLDEPVGGFPRYALLKLVELFHDVGKPKTAKVEDGKLHFHGHDHVGMKIAEKAAARLRLSNDETRTLARMVRSHMRPGNLGHTPALTDRAIYRFYRDLEGDAVGMLVVALADHFTYLSEKQKKSGKDPVVRTIKALLAANYDKKETVNPPKVVDGRLLMEKLDVPEGPPIGRLLAAIREAQASGKVKTQAQALTLAESLLESPEIQALKRLAEDRATGRPRLPIP